MIATEPIGMFGTFSQLNSGVTGTEALREYSCVPTSVANGLTFLSNYYSAPTLMLPGYGTVNTLSTDMGTTEAGTSYAGMGSGTASYFSGQGLASSFTMAGGETSPFMVTLYDWLLADYAVEFWISWASGSGAHSLTLCGIDLYTDSGGAVTGAGTLDFIDPYGGPISPSGNPSSAVVVTGASFMTDSGGAMHITDGYTTGGAANPSNPDNTSGATTGVLVNDLAEKFTPGGGAPEPSSLVLFGAGVLALVSKCRRQTDC